MNYLEKDVATAEMLGLDEESKPKIRHYRFRRLARRLLGPNGKRPYGRLRHYERLMNWYLRRFGDGEPEESANVEIRLTPDAQRTLYQRGHEYGYLDGKTLPVVVAHEEKLPARVTGG